MKIGDRVTTCEGFTGTITYMYAQGIWKYEVQWDKERQVSVGIKVKGAVYTDKELTPLEYSPAPVETDWREDYWKMKGDD